MLLLYMCFCCSWALFAFGLELCQLMNASLNSPQQPPQLHQPRCPVSGVLSLTSDTPSPHSLYPLPQPPSRPPLPLQPLHYTLPLVNMLYDKMTSVLCIFSNVLLRKIVSAGQDTVAAAVIYMLLIDKLRFLLCKGLIIVFLFSHSELCYDQSCSGYKVQYHINTHHS